MLGWYWGEPTDEADNDEAKEGALGASESEDDRGSASACASRESRRERLMKSSSWALRGGWGWTNEGGMRQEKPGWAVVVRPRGG